MSRIDIADEKQRNDYLARLKEAYRVVKKVGSKKDKQAMDDIKNKLKEKGFEI